MSRVVLVHGAFNELWGPNEIASRWVPALRDGLWHAGVDISPDEVSVAFYGDLFRLDPDQGEMPDPADLAAKSGLMDVIGSMPGIQGLETIAKAVGDAANERLMDQAGRFLAAGDVRRQVRARVDAELDEQTEVVVAQVFSGFIRHIFEPETDTAAIGAALVELLVDTVLPETAPL